MDAKTVRDIVYGENSFRYQIVPWTFVIFFTWLVQYLAVWGHGDELSLSLAIKNVVGDFPSWSICLAFYAWAIIWLKATDKVHLGPRTHFGYQPKYADNGWFYYVVTTLAYLALHLIKPNISFVIYDKFPKLVGISSALALSLCFYLLIKGKWFREHAGDVSDPAPVIYQYFRGMELHPRIFGVNLKQFTNCRVGLMAWQLLLIAFFLQDVDTNGIKMPSLMHLLIQTAYIMKFFWEESFYFHTVDMIMDRAGYYLSWGCLVFLPAFFCFPAAFVVNHPSTLPDSVAVLMGFLGVALTILQYDIDNQRYRFRQEWPKTIKIRGKPAEYILAEYVDSNGKRHKSPLLTSGYWGAARHLNYTVELCLDFLISASLGFNNGVWTFGYFLFLAPLLFHRILRDEHKCSLKYGTYWDQYKKKVPYILVPHIW